MKTMNKRFKTLLGGGLILLFSLVVIGHAGAQTCVQPPSGLVSWWPGDGNSNDIKDSNDGTLQNGATFAAGMVGQAFSFDGVDDFVRVPNAPSLEPQQLTIEASVFPKSVGSIGTCCQDAQGPIIISKDTTGTAAGSGVSYGILGPGTTGQFNANVRFTDGTQPSFSSTNSFGLNTWHHVAMTWDGNTIRLYVNGNLEGFSVVGPKTVAYSPHDLSIGRHSIFGGHRPFDGLIDEPAIYNRALSAAEIQAIFAAGSAGQCKATTVLDHFKCYKAEGASPNVAIDLEDQFGIAPGVLVKQPKLFCNPVDKNDEGIRNPAAHLTCYEIEAGAVKRNVVAGNQFGEQTLQVKEPKLLCVPSDKFLP